MTFDAREFFLRFVTALNEQDYKTVEALSHPDFVADSPQSGERVRGWAAWQEQLSQYPGVDEIAPQIEDAQIFGQDDRWAITPGYTVVPLAAPNEYTTVMRARYPDGSWWRVISIVELRDEKLVRFEVFYAPEMSTPLAESIAAFPHP